MYLCSYFFITKINNDKDFYLHPLWPKYPPFLFIFSFLERLCLYNREISLAVLLRQTGKTNMTKNCDKIMKCLKNKNVYDIFAISPTPYLELTGFVTALAQTALKSFSKFSFVWKYYQVCKQPLTETETLKTEKEKPLHFSFQRPFNSLTGSG